jgi:hypothetical protein
MAFPTLQNYETRRRRTPDARLLVAFLTCAIDHSRLDLADVFRRELLAVVSPPADFVVEIVVKRKGKQI